MFGISWQLQKKEEKQIIQIKVEKDKTVITKDKTDGIIDLLSLMGEGSKTEIICRYITEYSGIFLWFSRFPVHRTVKTPHNLMKITDCKRLFRRTHF